MKIPQDARFREERIRFALRFCCETCANYDAPSDGCVFEFPTAEHRRAYYDCPTAVLVFCKSYDHH